MKKWLKILIGIIALFTIAIAVVSLFTSGMVDIAEAFLKAGKQKNIAKARTFLAEDFKASTDEKALAVFFSKNAISDFKKANWSSRRVNGDSGELNGTITTGAGAVVPIKIRFVRENNVWKIYAIQQPTAGLESEDNAQPMPGKADQIALVQQSMRDFTLSVKLKNMEHFRKSVALSWQKQTSTEQFNDLFKAIIESGADLSILNRVQPIVSEAKISADGVLALSGYYSIKPSKVYFEQEYIYEGVSWKLFGWKSRYEMDRR